MTGDPNCHACVLRFDSEVNGWGGDECTGRPGCVRHPNRETPAPEKPPAGEDVPDGKGGDDIVERRADDGWRPVSFTERAAVVEEFRGREPWRHMANEIVRLRKIGAEKEAEIARLRAETVQMVELAEYKWAEAAAARGAVERLQADRAALATRVAEAVRCVALLVVDLRDRARIRAMDLGPIVAAEVAKEGE
ncbi:MAG: hypothetical protein IOB84_12580 [Brevundimonas sp.]|nr:hypothetical protein [Brevundimonas sp.]